MRRGLLLALALFAASAAAEGQAPKSAIDWLKRPAPGASGSGVVPDGAPGPRGTVEVVSIDAAALDSAGTLTEAESGVPLDFWRDLSALRARALLSRVRGSGTLAAADLYRRILLARARAPRAVGPGGGFLRLRVERLLQTGALADAQALLSAAGASGPAFNEYALTIGQLTAEDLAPCAAALAGEGTGAAVDIALESRIYCLIRLGREDEARGAIDAARDASDPAILDLLAAQIDPDLARIVTGPEDVGALSPLALALIDGVGAPRPANFSAAPAAYFWADLTEAAAPRDRLAAAEKLARAGAIPAARLITLYGRQRSAESGGVWGRVEAWRRMAAAAPAELAPLVAEMDRRAAEAGLRAALAPALNRYAAEAAPDAPTSRRFAEIALLAGDPAAALTRTQGETELEALAALLTGAPVPFPEIRGRARRGDVAAQRLAAALTAVHRIPDPLDEAPEAVNLAALAAESPAAAVLEALALLDAGAEIAPAPLHAALAALAAAGFDADARAVAVETLLGGRVP
jgi:hypothetical protein